MDLDRIETPITRLIESEPAPDATDRLLQLCLGAAANVILRLARLSLSGALQRVLSYVDAETSSVAGPLLRNDFPLPSIRPSPRGDTTIASHYVERVVPILVSTGAEANLVLHPRGMLRDRTQETCSTSRTFPTRSLFRRLLIESETQVISPAAGMPPIVSCSSA